jgi:hypothetical protein
MAYRDFPTTTMVELTAPWLDDARQAPLLRSFPQTAGLMENVVEAHQTLLRLQLVESQLQATIQALIAQLFELDRRHDRKLRGTFQLLTGLAELADTPEEVAALLALRDALFPSGLSAINLSYRDEAGHARLIAERLTDAQRAALAAIPAGSTHLLAHLTEMIDTARTLGEKAEELRQAKDGLGKDEDAVTRGDLLAARRQWVRVVQRVEDNLSFTQATAAQRDLILGPLHSAHALLLRAKKTPGAPSPAPVVDADPLPPSPTPIDDPA